MKCNQVSGNFHANGSVSYSHYSFNAEFILMAEFINASYSLDCSEYIFASNFHHLLHDSLSSQVLP